MNPILTSWDDIRQGVRGTRIIQDSKELEVLRIFEKAGHIKINVFVPLERVEERE